MKRELLTLAVISLASFGWSQAAPAAQQQQPASTPTPQQQTQPAQQQQLPASGTTGTLTTPEPAHSKGAPQAKTQEEFKAYQDVVAKAGNPTQMETAADEFAQKFPQSDLRTVLYNQLLNMYRQGGAPDREIEVGRKSLAIDPTDPVPNVLVATALAQTTRDTDLDKADRLTEATRDAQRAIDNIDTGMAIPPNTPPEKVAAAKTSLLEMAYETMGTVAMAKKDFPAAEAAFRKGIDVNKAQPDGVLYLRLAIALDNQGETKYPEALQATENAIKYTQPGTEAQNLANQEKARLQKLVGNSPAPATNPAPPAANPTPPAQ